MVLIARASKVKLDQTADLDQNGQSAGTFGFLRREGFSHHSLFSFVRCRLAAVFNTDIELRQNSEVDRGCTKHPYTLKCISGWC